MARHTTLAAGVFARERSLSEHMRSAIVASQRLRSALPLDIADSVLEEIETARARRLPVGALEHRALLLAASGTSPEDIVRGIAAYHHHLLLGREALRVAGRHDPSDNEIEAAAATLDRGIPAAAVSALAHTTSDDRPLAVPFLVVANLLDRGLPADDVMAAMHVWLDADASDTELHDLAGSPPRSALTVIRRVRAVQRIAGAGTSRRRPSNHP